MTTDNTATNKRGRKAGGHNTKQVPIMGKRVEDKFEDNPTPTKYKCWNCGHSSEMQFKYCSECGSENKWS